ncbi:hypothetical protein BAWEI_07280 [Bacillus mycoides]|uniref:Restriction endonuclease n=2 Tax=Bacillus mycoides TaxID=1405 RepID=A0AAP8GZ64_BACMY|nr:hypothetical protein BAWEI_07280 [Bacillus mycoides]PJN70231.1 hypothetical protein BACWE_32720 [Bacillus mycoides]
MFNHTIARRIAMNIGFLDISCRSDLSRGLLVSERDYVSRLTTHMSYPRGPWFKASAYCLSLTLPGGLEQTFGADSIIIFKKDAFVKVGMFEAKWPRTVIKKGKYSWDNRDANKVYSRFSSQLQRQRKWTNEVAIWEMFFYEQPNRHKGGFYNPYGSTCIWHQDMYNHFMINRRKKFRGGVWDQSDLDSVFSNYGTRKFGDNLAKILYQILTCKMGKPLVLNKGNTSFAITSNNGKIIKDVPTPFVMNRQGIDTHINNPITLFMERNGISLYMFFDLDDRNDREDLNDNDIDLNGFNTIV